MPNQLKTLDELAQTAARSQYLAPLPECREPGCLRAPYLGGRCKRHADEAWYREAVVTRSRPDELAERRRQDAERRRHEDWLDRLAGLGCLTVEAMMHSGRGRLRFDARQARAAGTGHGRRHGRRRG